jgi:cytosine deaminase
MAQADGCTSNLTIHNVRPLGGAATDVHIRDGQFVDRAAEDAEVMDGGGALLLPGLIEGHTHLDKTTRGAPCHRNTIGPSRT